MEKLFISSRIILEDRLLDGGIFVSKYGKILKVLNKREALDFKVKENIEIIDVNDLVLMPGIIDSHVHVNDPGRSSWEGFETVTRAAAAGGITTIVDMPLNSIPPTTTLENLKIKVAAARGRTFVDVAFWGGVVPNNQNELLKLADAGVVGFKCFMCPSGVHEFPHVNLQEIEAALRILQRRNVVLAFHAEIDQSIEVEGDPTQYETFLQTRPASMETEAIKQIILLANKYRVKLHIVHLSAAEALPLLVNYRKNGTQISVETCHHYLSFKSEDVADKATHFKCCPPIRDSNNQEILWAALKHGIINMVVSDHSPCTPDLKHLDTGDFLKAWGGVSSVQFGLSLFWTEAKMRGFTIFDINKYMTLATAKLVGLHNRKGKIVPNYDADFVVWDPFAVITIEESMIQHKNKITPYIGKELYGKVFKTIVRGQVVYETGMEFSSAKGTLLLDSKHFCM